MLAAAAPIERIKLLVQNQDEMIKTGRLAEPYKVCVCVCVCVFLCSRLHAHNRVGRSFFFFSFCLCFFIFPQGVGDCFRRVVAEEGFGSLWRGNLANVLRYFPTQVCSCCCLCELSNAVVFTAMCSFVCPFPTPTPPLYQQALNFAFKDKIKAMFNRKKENGYGLWFLSNMASGGIAGAMSLCFVYSLDFARTRLANDNKSSKGGGERQFNGLLDVYRKTMASDGFAGLYRGFAVSCVGIIIYRGCYFGFFDTLKPMMPANMQDSFMASFALGWVVTITAGLASYPLDTIRRRMMMTSGEAVKYNSAFDAAAQIMKAEGVSSFFKGAGANILRGVAGAGVLAGFDKFKQLYVSWRFTDEEN